MRYLGPTPSDAADLVTKAYADSVGGGGGSVGGMLAPVHLATTGAETYTISSGSVTQINGTTIDGVAPDIGDRILITTAPASSGAGTAWTYTTQPANGVYTVTGNSTNLTVARASDLSGSVHPGGVGVFVMDGFVWGQSGWFVAQPVTQATFIYGVGVIKWTAFIGLNPHFNQVFGNELLLWNGTGQTTLSTDSSAGDITVKLPGSPTGSTLLSRSVVSVTSVSTFGAAKGHEYVYLLKTGAVPTLPTAVGNTAFYRVKNTTDAPITLLSAGGTIDGSTSISLRPSVSVDIVSDGTNYFVI